MKKKKKEHCCVFVFKGIGLHPPALLFLPWTRVYNSSWLLKRWSRWNVQEIHSRASCLNNVAEGSAPVPCQPGSNWQYISRFLKTFYKKEKKKRSQTTTKGKRKRATPEHPPAPVRLRFLFLPWNNYKETFQAKYLVLMVSHCSISQPRPFPFYVYVSEQNKFINGFPYINTIEKKQVWNLNYHGTQQYLGPLGVCQKV